MEIEKHLDAVLSQWAPIFTEFEKDIVDQDNDDNTCGDCQVM